MESGMEKPQCLIIGFEKNIVNEETNDASRFSDIDVPDFYRIIGIEIYPEDRMKITIKLAIVMKHFKII